MNDNSALVNTTKRETILYCNFSLGNIAFTPAVRTINLPMAPKSQQRLTEESDPTLASIWNNESDGVFDSM